ncbi:formimidoylglutamase [Natrarchaeobius sp. A-rgal3]|uniref:formimidoylglutamase n=1 Tax=Natrarchaeobius versutus TaxID=1679078 RepID=UPI003510251C
MSHRPNRPGKNNDESPFARPEWDGWGGPSSDPNDRQFGDVVEAIDLEDANDYDAVLVGEPYDGAVIGRRGAREGPGEIRRSLAGVKTAHLRTGGVSVRIGDLGDLEFPDGDVSDVQEYVEAVAAEIHAIDALPVFVGGDNSLSYPNVAPLLAERAVAVVNVDAHLDCRAVRGEPTSGTPYRQLLESGLETYVPVGARHFETSGPYVEYVRDRGGTIVPADAFESGVDAVVAAVEEAIESADTLYLSVDCDALDASAAPGVSAPTPGGLSTRELFAAVSALAGDDRLAGLEIVECAPPLESGRLTAEAAARTIAHGLAGYWGDHRE